jgi:hypothetical protein
MQRSVSWTKSRRCSKKAKLYTYLPKKLHYKVTLMEPLLLVAHNSQSLLPHKRYGYKHNLDGTGLTQWQLPGLCSAKSGSIITACTGPTFL